MVHTPKVYSSLVGVPGNMCGHIPLGIMRPTHQAATVLHTMTYAHVPDPMPHSRRPLFREITIVTPAMVATVTPQMGTSFQSLSGMDRVRHVSLGPLAVVGQDNRGLKRPCHNLLLMTLSFDGVVMKHLSVKLQLQSWWRYFFVLPNT